jgi:hypothetical protein
MMEPQFGPLPQQEILVEERDPASEPVAMPLGERRDLSNLLFWIG